jgi:2-polyprenyl-3-methyl-5-hydroxy-6-metoxy-1,4-benzoquinol methylase
MKDIEFQEEDKEGHSTLETIAKADKFNQWMFRTILPHCSGKILEIGSGIGNISRYFLESGWHITLSDIRKNYCDSLMQQFEHKKTLDGVLQINLTDQDFEMKYERLRNSFDTIFALNVVEHIKNDTLALNNAQYILKEQGNLIILVPAFQCLYNNFDEGLGHYRRYTKRTLQQIFTINRMNIVHSQYFNLMGIAGWFLSGKLLGKKSIPEGQMGIYNRLVPIFKIIDRITLHTFGLSVIVVGRKNMEGFRGRKNAF